ncbi:MAG: NUDIX hydrolase [Candidatus Geothermarchaeota archaeon]
MELLEDRLLCKGKRVKLYSRKYKVGDRVITRDVVNFGRSVAILPILNEKEIILINQFRAPIGKWILEVPAGIIENGESWLDAAKRELIEETGYNARTFEKVLSICLSPGYSDETMTIVFAKDLEYVGERPEETEFIQILKLSVDEAYNRILSEEIKDAKTLLALMLYKLRST